MSVSDEVPPQWHQYFEAAGFDSFRDVANASGVSPTTVIACLKPGSRMPKAPTLEKVAAALRITPEKLKQLRGDPHLEPFTLPSAADALAPTERRAVLEVIRSFAHNREQEDQRKRRDDALISDLTKRISDSLRAQEALYVWLSHREGMSLDALTEHFVPVSEPLIESVPIIANHLAQSSADRDALSRAINDLRRMFEAALPRDVAQSEFELAARDTGTKSRGRQMRERQDREAEASQDTE